MRHRTLAREKFIESIDLALLQRYRESFTTELRPTLWAFLTKENLHSYLSNPANSETSIVIIEDFQRMNDLSEAGMSIVTSRCNADKVIFDPNEPAAQIVMKLFLENREAFDGAWSRFLIYSSPYKQSIYLIPKSGLNIEQSHMERFQAVIQKFYAEQARGKDCMVKSFADQNEIFILIRHGEHTIAMSSWEDGKFGLKVVHPALEDILIFNRSNSTVQMKVRTPKDRFEYLKAFCGTVAGDAGLAEKVVAESVFDLTPIQQGKFEYQGEYPITRIELVKIRLKVSGRPNAEFEIKSANVPATLKEYFGTSTANEGIITSAKLRFRIEEPDKKHVSVTFDIEPPSRTSLPDKGYADKIQAHLKAQGVMKC